MGRYKIKSCDDGQERVENWYNLRTAPILQPFGVKTDLPDYTPAASPRQLRNSGGGISG